MQLMMEEPHLPQLPVTGTLSLEKSIAMCRRGGNFNADARNMRPYSIRYERRREKEGKNVRRAACGRWDTAMLPLQPLEDLVAGCASVGLLSWK